MWGSSFMNKVHRLFCNCFRDDNDPPIQWVGIVLVAAALVGWIIFGLTSPVKAEPSRGDFLAMRSTPDISIAATATAEVLFFGPPAFRIYLKNDCADDLYFDLRSIREGNSNLYPLRLSGRKTGGPAGAASPEAETFTFEGRVHSLGVSHGVNATSSDTCTYTLILAR